LEETVSNRHFKITFEVFDFSLKNQQ